MNKPLWHSFWTPLVLLAFGAAWIWFSRIPPDQADQVSPSVPYTGFLAPDFEVTHLDGQRVKLSDYQGSPVVLNFWATWCLPCRVEMPALQRIHEDYQDSGLVMLAVNATHLDSIDGVRAFTQEHGLTLPVVLDLEGAASTLYQVRAMPTTFFIAANGEIVDIAVGGPLSEATIRLKVEDMISNPGGS